MVMDRAKGSTSAELRSGTPLSQQQPWADSPPLHPSLHLGTAGTSHANSLHPTTHHCACDKDCKEAGGCQEGDEARCCHKGEGHCVGRRMREGAQHQVSCVPCSFRVWRRSCATVYGFSWAAPACMGVSRLHALAQGV